MAARVSRRPASAWALLAESDSDSDTPPSKLGGKGGVATVSASKLAVAEEEKLGFQGDMEDVLAAMAGGTQTWGDIMSERGTVAPVATTVPMVHRRRANTSDDFWALPFTARLQELWSDCYDVKSLSDPEWEELMRWLYDAGWDVGSYDRNSVEFEEANGPRRIWVPPSELEAMMEEEAALRRRRDHHHNHHHHHCHAAKPVAGAAAPVKEPRKKSGTVPRFCREAGACKEEGCRYVHDDTIPRVNKPCGFGESCGASDPTGVKRSQCLYMHPGEEWIEGLSITRPSA